MLYVLMYENPYGEGNYPIAVVDEFGKCKIQKMEFERHSTHLLGLANYASAKVLQYHNDIKGYESVPEVQETLSKYNKEYELKRSEYEKFLTSKNEYYTQNGTGCLNFGELVLHPFEISGYEIGDEIYEEDYTKEIKIKEFIDNDLCRDTNDSVQE